MRSEPDRDMEKLGGDHKERRTAAIASLKVGCYLLCKAAGWARTTVMGFCICAHTVAREWRPSSAGAVRRMARSDHWRCVSTPRCSCTSWRVVSIRQRQMKRFRIAVGSRSSWCSRLANRAGRPPTQPCRNA